MITPEFRTGRLVADPELRYLPNSDKRIVNFTIAQSTSRKDEAGNWVVSKSLYVDVVVWDDTRYEDTVPWTDWCLEFLAKGTEVVVFGSMETRTWEHNGQKRSKIQFTAQSVYPSLRSLARIDTPPSTDRGLVHSGAQSSGGFSGGRADENPPF